VRTLLAAFVAAGILGCRAWAAPYTGFNIHACCGAPQNGTFSSYRLTLRLPLTTYLWCIVAGTFAMQAVLPLPTQRNLPKHSTILVAQA